MKFILFLLLLLPALWLQSQIQKPIFGFDCVTSGVDYEYKFNNGWDSSASIKICLTGGVFADDNSTCKTQDGLVYVKVKWDDRNSKGTITVTYPRGTITKTVSITPQISGGAMNDDIHVQTVDSGKKPKNIVCSVPKGGNCNPGYSYQWQQSQNILVWEDIKGATDKDLQFSTGITEQTFYRRKVVETGTGNIAYSEPVVVYVIPQ